MGILDSFEQGLERVVNGAFAKTFKSGLQPLEVTAALRRELDTKAAVVSRDRILAPNQFTVRLAPADFEPLIDEFTQLVQQHAAAQHYSFAGGITITLAEDPALSQGIVRIDSVNVKGEIEWVPTLDIAGEQHRLPTGRTVIGRGSDADITIDDPGTSRKHIEILWDGKRGQVKDLGSTNGSKLNGVRLDTAPLQPDSVIELGRTRIVFRVLAHAAGTDPRNPRTP